MEAALQHQSQWPSQKSDERERIAILEVSIGHMQRAADQQLITNKEATDRMQSLAHRLRHLDQGQAYHQQQIEKNTHAISRLMHIANNLEFITSVLSHGGTIMRWGLTILLGWALVTGRINGEQIDKLMTLFKLG